MKKLTVKEQREVMGGKWKCKNCGQKFPAFISMWSSGFGAKHENCILSGFKYKWVAW